MPGLTCRVCDLENAEGARFCSACGAALVVDQSGAALLGKTVAGKFRIEKLLGNGAMGRVYLVDSAGRGVLGIPTPFGVTGVSKREMSAQLDAFEQGWGQALRAVCAPR